VTCEVVESYQVEQVARCGFLLLRNLTKTCMCAELNLCTYISLSVMLNSEVTGLVKLEK